MHSPTVPEPCNSAAEFWAQLNPTDSVQQTVYRGQGNADDRLIPKVLRRQQGQFFVETYWAGPLTVEDQIVEEVRLITDFVNHCDNIGLALPNDSIKRRRKALNPDGTGWGHFQKFPPQWPDDDWIELMALAQHHGVPTRLLDWSRRSHVAAYFAAADALQHREQWNKRSNPRLAVWALDTAGLEGLTPHPTGSPPYRPETLIPHVRVVTVPGATSNHLAAQAGLFTLQKEVGQRRAPLVERSLEDDLPAATGRLRKHTLPVTEAAKLLHLCELHGITAATIFRSYDGAARAVLETIARRSEGPLGRNAPDAG